MDQQPINWTLTAREARQEILEGLAKNQDRIEARKVALLIRVHMKYISKYNFAGVDSSFPGMRETICGDYKIYYKIRQDQVTVTGIFPIDILESRKQKKSKEKLLNEEKKQASRKKKS
ncbi:type II toxin-antitoxin system RelE/ParE family toxin [Reichenbachiella versicolor]|uniref:type II toxin-antitoxin system RelE/ParE family toxin n=1 Tax=Reichenbachiella versicolor TaxID=1821036 RepID=UPI000D6E6DB4|nr:hypothetical protein [Reichenbachiella versicolor]